MFPLLKTNRDMHDDQDFWRLYILPILFIQVPPPPCHSFFAPRFWIPASSS